jgi:predicted Zn-dependent protease
VERIAEDIHRIISENRGYGFEFIISDWKTEFFRFFNSESNYNISRSSFTVSGTIEKDKRKYDFKLSNPSGSDIEDCIESAKSILDKLPPDPDFHSFENNPDIFQYDALHDSTSEILLEKKIEILTKIAEKVKSRNFDIYGTFAAIKRDCRIINSAGIDKHFYQSPVMLDVKAVSNKNMATVIENFGGNSLDTFDLNLFISNLEKKIGFAGLDIIDMPQGEYEVILSPHSVGEFASFLMYCAYAQTLDEGTSFFEGKTGQKIFPSGFTLSSDPVNPRVITFPYNEDGHIAGKVDIIKDGVFKNFVVDHYYGHKLGLEKNGAVGVDAIAIEKGSCSLDDMISGIENGLFISNIHYMNFINMKDTSVTGLTRDGTFLIRNGRIVSMVNNLRFTERLSSIFANTVDIENKLYPVTVSSNYFDFKFSSRLVPHIKAGNFNISSSTHTI